MSQPPKSTPDDPTVADEVSPHHDGQTTPQGEAKRAGKSPHERDESSASQQGAPSELMQKAHDDVERGLVDTSRAEVTDATYGRELRPEPQGSGAPDVDADRRLDTSTLPGHPSEVPAGPPSRRR